MDSNRSTPNVLLIMDDQHHAGCLGYRGHPDVKTPHIDALARQGVRFDECFCQNGVCTPSRVSYMTGMYCHSHGVYTNESHAIPSSLRSLPHLLQRHGYRTALVGKKHLPQWEHHGFQYERFCCDSDGPAESLHYYKYLEALGLHGRYGELGDVKRFTLSREPQLPAEHSFEGWTGTEAVRYLESCGPNDPFFLMVGFERPHPPLTVPEGCPVTYDPGRITLPSNDVELPLNESSFFFARGGEAKWVKSVHGEDSLREALCAYYALISLIDEQVGKIIQSLEDQDLRDNTIVIFCADHGDFAGEYGKMGKGWNYDAVHRVPFVWSWPGHFEAGRIHQGLVETVDLFPTICNLANVSVPRTVQGMDLAETLMGEGAESKDAVFYEFVGVKTIRTKKYKLSYGFDGEREIGELFDLVADPHEYKNLFVDATYASTRESLLRRLLNWIIETGQPPNFQPGYEKLPASRWFEGG
jgi:arylsulfatase A-like enzyme